MAVTIVLGILLGGYTAWVIRRKIRDIKNGKFCSCSCEGCTGKCSGKGGKSK